eukprot:scaffold29801_cov112-Isochrysis_galbana.AAC.2
MPANSSYGPQPCPHPPKFHSTTGSSLKRALPPITTIRFTFVRTSCAPLGSLSPTASAGDWSRSSRLVMKPMLTYTTEWSAESPSAARSTFSALGTARPLAVAPPSGQCRTKSST